MDIGEKIKEIRIAKCMTQAQLAGDFITRNMLSLIENGAAKPSLTTVQYLAERLKIPVGYLLAEDNENHIYKKMYNMENIKRAFTDGDYRICRDICRSIEVCDDELYLILACCDAGIAKEEFFFGKLRSSVRFFEEALEYDAKTIYSNGVIRAEATVYLRYMRRISPTLIADVAEMETCDEMSLSDRICGYVIALEKIESKDLNIIENTMNTYCANQETPLTVHIKARHAMMSADYVRAKNLLINILNLQERIADPILYSVFHDLEICSRELDDYRGAYEYSADKVNLLERMLAEVDDI